MSAKKQVKQSKSSDKKFKTPNAGRRLKNLSHSLSWALRHAAPQLGLTMTPDGFVPVQEILQCNHSKFKAGYSNSDIVEVVRTNDKKRFTIAVKPASDYYDDKDGHIECIRANQGHTIKSVDPDQLLTRLSPEELAAFPTIVHGTYFGAWDAIKKCGYLSRMNRQHIHFAVGLLGEDGVISGMRKSCEVYVYIDPVKCANDNIIFYRSDNGVLLTAAKDGKLELTYLKKATDRNGNTLYGS